MKTNNNFLRFLAIVPAFALALTFTGCGKEEAKVIVQPENAQQEMEDYGAAMEEQAGGDYGS
ncbi:MAG: hypothetical protein WBD31_14430 [Rubripirellula sp.]